MSAEPRGLARRASQVLTAAAVVAGGVVVAASPAYAAPPTVTAVVLAGTTSKVVSVGSTIVITGTGFAGMTDNSADTVNCNIAPVTTTACSQVRFVGQAVSATAGFTLATRYTVVNDTTIYATVPSLPATVDLTTVGAAVPGTGSVKVQVVNTMPGGGSSLGSTVGATSEIFYRAPLTADISGPVQANPLGGGTIPVDITSSPIAALTSGPTGTLAAEKITAYVANTFAGSAKVTATSVTFNDANTVNVVLPPGGASSEYYSVMLVHDGYPGTADSDSLKYPSVITKIESCTVDVTTIGATLPTCTGPATAPGTASTTADIKLTGKGFTGATNFQVGSTAGDVTETCTVVSDFLVYCHLAITTVPSGGVAVVTFTADDPDNAANPAVAPTGGSVLVFGNLV